MNEILAGDNPKGGGSNKIYKPEITATREEGSSVITKNSELVDAQGNKLKPTNPKENKDIKAVLDYNNSVLNIEENYSGSKLKLMNGIILVRLFKKIPWYRGLYKGFAVPVVGAKQLKPEFAEDPYFFNNIGVVVNYDWTYKRDEHLMFDVGDVVEVDPLQSMTVIKKLEGMSPYLQNAYFRYDEERSYTELGYITITKRDLKSVINEFKMEDYERAYFKF